MPSSFGTWPAHQSTPTELKRLLWISLPGLKKRLDRLLERGLISRRENPQDARGFVVALTPRGLDASTDPYTECAQCDHDAAHHDGAAGACTRQGVDSEGLYWCDCAAFTLGDDAA